uniref:Uncharacterized protein n=1 Tax=Vitis vinifera TaxID=29760 RepID=A5C9J9_VITVI|nr:hypothetical protein VITISV_042913 [Vitis vinifera]
MAASLQLPMASSIPSSSSPSTTRPIFKTHCSMKPTCSAKIPMPPINPKDPFLSKLASVAATSPERLLQRPSGSDSLPFLDLFDSPKLMATPAQAIIHISPDPDENLNVERSVSYNEHRPRRPPPDLPSLLLHGRIVYIGMPVFFLFFKHVDNIE